MPRKYQCRVCEAVLSDAEIFRAQVEWADWWDGSHWGWHHDGDCLVGGELTMDIDGESAARFDGQDGVWYRLPGEAGLAPSVDGQTPRRGRLIDDGPVPLCNDCRASIRENQKELNDELEASRRVPLKQLCTVTLIALACLAVPVILVWIGTVLKSGTLPAN
jgi:hypothetical protein